MAQQRRAPRKPGRASATRIERRRAAVERRRAFARAGLAAQLTARRRRRRLLQAGVAAVVAAVVAVVVILWRRGDDGPTADLVAERVEADEPLAITEPPAAYTVTYRVQTFVGEQEEVATEVRTIRRPFDARIVGLTGEPPGTTEQFAVTGTLGLSASSSATAPAEADGAVPGIALGDVRLDATLVDLVADGTAVQRERRTLLGRDCQVYRTGLPPEASSVTAPTETDYTDVCVDAAGVVLEQVQVAAGSVLQHRTAVAIDDRLVPDDEMFEIEAQPPGVDGGGTEVSAADPAAEPVAGYWSFSALPDGFEHVGRYVVRQPAPAPPVSPEGGDTAGDTAGQAPIESYADVYRSGSQAIVVHQGPVAAQPAGDVTAAEPTPSEVFGTVQVASGVDGTTILARPAAPPDWFVQVTGTLPRAELSAIADTLAQLGA